VHKCSKTKYYRNGFLTDIVFMGNKSSTCHAIEYGLELLKKEHSSGLVMAQISKLGGILGYLETITTTPGLTKGGLGIDGFQTFCYQMGLGTCSVCNIHRGGHYGQTEDSDIAPE
jgi:hypothetical protein